MTCAAGAAALAALVAVGPAGAGDRGYVLFATPDDPIVLALYPRIDPLTGITPVAEPAVAAGRSTPRAVDQEGCRPGFRIAEPVDKAWSWGGKEYLIAFFFVTTDNQPGVNAPCYRPEPWVCVLEYGPGGGVPVPVDCARVEQDVVFPDEPAIDTAPFRLSETERAFGVRLRYTTGLKTSLDTPSALVLFRLHERRLSQVLALQIGMEQEEFGSGECARELALGVAKTKTAGMFDWTTRTSRKTGKLPCALETGTYTWDGTRYVKAARGKE